MTSLTERIKELKSQVEKTKAAIQANYEEKDRLNDELNEIEVEQHRLKDLSKIQEAYKAGEPVLFLRLIWFYADDYKNLGFNGDGGYSIATVEEVETYKLALGDNEKRRQLREEWLAKNNPNTNPLKPGDIVTCRDASWSFSITPRAEIKHIPISASLFKYEGVYQNQKRRTVIAIAPPGKPFPFRPSPVPPGKWENNTIVQDEDGTLHFVHHKGLIKVDD